MCEQSSQFCENQIHVKMLYVWTITLSLTKARVYLTEETANQMCDIYQIVYWNGKLVLRNYYPETLLF